MAKKKPQDRSQALQVRCTAADIAAFKQAAERDGHVNLTAWVLYTLRRAERESRAE